MSNPGGQEFVILTKNLSKSFDGSIVVEDLNLEIPRGSIFGFIGPSGCGKTTSVRLLLGIYTPDSGEMRVLNQDPQHFDRNVQESIGYMPQQFVLYPELSVWENLNFSASIYGVPIRRKERLKELLDLVELTGHENKRVENLSGGMMRRLSLAASIIHDPVILFLDEPTAGIDPVLRRKFWEYFQVLKGEGRTLFVTTQYVGEAAYCDYVGVMFQGRLLAVDTPKGLRQRALGGEIIHLYSKNIMSEMNFSDLRGQPFVLDGKVYRLRDRGIEIVVEDASSTLPKLMDWCHDKNIQVESASEHIPLFDDVFVQLIEAETKAQKVEIVHD